jgi:hypothetical protein
MRNQALISLKFPALAMCLGADGVLAQTLSPAEQKIVQTVDAQNTGSVSFLEQLVNVNSGTLNSAGVRQIYDILAPSFATLASQSDRFRWMKPIVRGISSPSILRPPANSCF